MAIRVILLAAGRGSRMGDNTDSHPKCQTLLAGKQLIEWQLEAMRNCGLTDITVVRGYKAENLDGEYLKIDNPSWSTTQMVASLFCVPDSQKDSIISYTDIVYNPQIIEKLMSAPGDIVISADILWEKLWNIRFANPLDDAEKFKGDDNVLTDIGGHTENIADIEAQYMGLIKITSSGWQSMYELYRTFPEEKRNKIDMTSMISELLKNQIKVNIIYIEGRWCEVDTFSDVTVYEKQLSKAAEWVHDWRWK